jgi:hypothetical protein
MKQTKETQKEHQNICCEGCYRLGIKEGKEIGKDMGIEFAKEQYNEGFINGKAQAINEFKEKLREKFTEANNILYPAWKAKEIIDKTAQEILG